MPRSDLSVVASHACGWPNLTRLSNGDLVCAYFNEPSHGLVEGDLVCSKSFGSGRKWKKTSVIASHPPRGNRMHLAVGLSLKGDILCFNSGFFLDNGNYAGFSGQWLCRSVDGGNTWIEDRDPNIPRKLTASIPYGRIVQTGDSCLAYACYRSQGRGNPSESWVCFSDDDGHSWGRFHKLGRNDSNEVALCSLSNGKLLAAVRTHFDHHLKICEYLPLRHSWRERGSVTLPMQHPADLIEAFPNCLLLTYGLRNRGLMGLGIRISVDHGSTWLAPCVIHQFENQAKDIGYPSTITLDKEGNMLTAYYTDFEKSFGKSASMYRVIVKRWNLFDWLCEKSRKTVCG